MQVPTGGIAREPQEGRSGEIPEPTVTVWTGEGRAPGRVAWRFRGPGNDAFSGFAYAADEALRFVVAAAVIS